MTTRGMHLCNLHGDNMTATVYRILKRHANQWVSAKTLVEETGTTSIATHVSAIRNSVSGAESVPLSRVDHVKVNGRWRKYHYYMLKIEPTQGELFQ